MKIWNRPRGSGKTIRMLYASEYTGKNILVSTKQRAEQLEFEARSQIDWWTFSRLKKDAERGVEMPEEVKRCMFKLIELLPLL